MSKAKVTHRPQLYVLEWVDILGDSSWHEGPLEKAEPATCVTCGWLVLETDKKLILADSKGKDGGWGGLTVIPAGVVVSRHRVSAKSPEAFMEKK